MTRVEGEEREGSCGCGCAGLTVRAPGLAAPCALLVVQLLRPSAPIVVVPSARLFHISTREWSSDTENERTDSSGGGSSSGPLNEFCFRPPGWLTVVAPCSFVCLSAYLSGQLGDDDVSSRRVTGTPKLTWAENPVDYDSLVEDVRRSDTRRISRRSTRKEGRKGQVERRDAQ